MAPSIGSAAMVTALFTDASSVERAFDAALARGYSSEEISLVLSEDTRRRHFKLDQVETELADKAAESTEKKQPENTSAADKVGGPPGGTMATVGTALGAVGAAALLPGLALAGPIAIALAAGAAVGVAGGLVGLLTNWGIPKGRVEEYESHIREGGILIGVQARSDEDTAYLKNEWQAAGGKLVHA